MQLLSAGRGNAMEMAFAPDGLALVAAFAGTSPALWELPASGRPRFLAEKPSYYSHDFTFSPDGAVVGWLAEQKRQEFDRGTGERRTVELLREREGINAQVVCGPDARLIVRTVERGAGFRILAFTGGAGGSWSAAWALGPSDDFRGWELVATAGEQFFTWEGYSWGDRNRARLVARSAQTGDAQHSTTTPASWLTGLAAPPDGSIVAGFNGSSLYAWRPGEGRVAKVRTGTLTHYRTLAFHPDGRHLLAGNNDATARLIDTRSWQVVRQFTWKIGRLTAVAISPDGALAAAGGTAGRVVVWDTDL